MHKTKINIIPIILFLFISLETISQNINISSKQKVSIDHLENVYITEKDNFSLISSEKKKEYQNSFLGEIYSVDVSNPLRILVFHKEANQIIFLNNELSIIGEAISLDELNLPDISVSCASQINGFWVYNNLNNRIEFFDDKLRKIHSSIDLSSRIQNLSDIQEISMNFENIYLRVKNTGILQFDMFGTYIKTIPIINSTSFQVMERSILYTLLDQVLIYNFDKLETTILFQSESNIEYAKVINNKIFTLTNDTLSKHNLTGIDN